MSIPETVHKSSEEHKVFLEAFESAYHRGILSEREFTRARIKGALAQWHLQAWEAAGRPEPVPDTLLETAPPIESVGIPEVDKALPHIRGQRVTFLESISYLCRERTDAAEIAKERSEKLEKAAALLREAAALLDGQETRQLGRITNSLAQWVEMARYGRVFPVELQGNEITGQYAPDALTAPLTAKRGTPSRRAVIVKALAQWFPNGPELAAIEGYSLICALARCCGIDAKPAFVRSVLQERGRRGEPKAAPAAAPEGDKAGRDIASLMRLLDKPK